MPKVTWLGVPGDDETNIACGVTLKKGEAVETNDERLLAMASGHPHFKVEGYIAPPDKPPEESTAPKEWPAPSTVSPQHPVAKPGEPIPGTEPEAPAEQPQPLAAKPKAPVQHMPLTKPKPKV